MAEFFLPSVSTNAFNRRCEVVVIVMDVVILCVNKKFQLSMFKPLEIIESFRLEKTFKIIKSNH